jgi:hypothetical protein
MVRWALLLLALPSIVLAARVTHVQSVSNVGTLDYGSGLARDLLANGIATGNAITYLFGDTLGVTNPDGNVASSSGSRATFADPFTLTNFPTGSVGQVVPYTSAEATWNLEGSGQHPHRIGLPPCGAVAEGEHVRVFYEVDHPPYSGLPEGYFYEGFPMIRLGTGILRSDQHVITRVPASEVSLDTDEWPTGFHRLPDGAVRFYRQFPHDGEPISSFKRARWTPDRGFEFDDSVAFKLGASLGISVWWSARQRQWLVAYVDHQGVVRLTALNGRVTSAVGANGRLYAIPGWAENWDGYGAAYIEGADTGGGSVFHIAFSRVTGPLSGDVQVIEVTIQ